MFQLSQQLTEADTERIQRMMQEKGFSFFSSSFDDRNWLFSLDDSPVLMAELKIHLSGLVKMRFLAEESDGPLCVKTLMFDPDDDNRFARYLARMKEAIEKLSIS